MLELAKDHQVTFYDQRSLGKSIHGKINKRTINLTQSVEDLEVLRKSLNYNKFTLIGHSWGDRLAMEYAIKYPKNLYNLVLLNPAPATFLGQLSFAAEIAKCITPISHKVSALFNYLEFAKLNAEGISKSI